MSRYFLCITCVCENLCPDHGNFLAVPHPRSLLTMAKKKGRRETMMAIDALKDLFLSDLLPGDRKLMFFYQQPLTFAVRFAAIFYVFLSRFSLFGSVFLPALLSFVCFGLFIL